MVCAMRCLPVPLHCGIRGEAETPAQRGRCACVLRDQASAPPGGSRATFSCVLQLASCSTLKVMRLAIQARLDERSRKRLAVLVRELGWTPSQVVREGLRVLEASYLRRKRRGVIGLGKFRSGVADLGSNKKHLRDFGRAGR